MHTANSDLFRIAVEFQESQSLGVFGLVRFQVSSPEEREPLAQRRSASLARRARSVSNGLRVMGPSAVAEWRERSLLVEYGSVLE